MMFSQGLPVGPAVASLPLTMQQPAAPGPGIVPAPAPPAGPVEALKDLQRSDQQGREQWGAYCDQHGGGIRDPNKHEPSFVQAFLTQFHAGHRLDVTSEAETLAELVKQGQRKSAPWKQAWAAYCQTYGGGVNDPSKHDHAFLKGFIDFLGQQGNMMLGGGMMGGGRSGGGYGMGDDPKKMALVQRIKAFQRMGEEQKGLWGAHCDNVLGGVRDPMRHDPGALQAFCSKNNVP